MKHANDFLCRIKLHAVCQVFTKLSCAVNVRPVPQHVYHHHQPAKFVNNK